MVKLIEDKEVTEAAQSSLKTKPLPLAPFLSFSLQTTENVVKAKEDKEDTMLANSSLTIEALPF